MVACSLTLASKKQSYIRCHPLLATPEALAVVGPGAFGYDVAYRPLEPGGPLPWTSLS